MSNYRMGPPIGIYTPAGGEKGVNPSECWNHNGLTRQVNRQPGVSDPSGTSGDGPEARITRGGQERAYVIPTLPKIAVSEETLRATTKCNNGFACLSKPQEMLCPVKFSIAEVYFIERKAGLKCDYCEPYGYGHYCACPVRQEIYKRHGL